MFNVCNGYMTMNVYNPYHGLNDVLKECMFSILCNAVAFCRNSTVVLRSSNIQDHRNQDGYRFINLYHLYSPHDIMKYCPSENQAASTMTRYPTDILS